MVSNDTFFSGVEARTGPAPLGSESSSDLITRWLQTVDGKRTRRDQILQVLKTSCHPGKPERPAELDLRGVSLDGEDLSGLDLSGYDLSEADLTGTNLRGTNLSRARLVRATLCRADLSESELLAADLTDADFEECRASRAGFGVARLAGASFFNSRLNGATFTKADLSGADFGGADMRGARMVEANLTSANFTKAILSEADFESSDVNRAVFTNADLKGSHLHYIKNFETAVWIGADIEHVHFCGAYLVRRFIMDQNYIHEFRNQSRWHECLYWIWWLTSDCGRSLLRWTVVTAVIVLFYAASYSFVSLDYAGHRTWFSPVYYSIVTLTTLGYGDVTPVSVAAQILATTEAVAGYLMLGGLLSILANKMARRAD